MVRSRRMVKRTAAAQLAQANEEGLKLGVEQTLRRVKAKVEAPLIVLILSLTLGLFTNLGAAEAGLSPEQIVREFGSAVVLIQTRSGLGSGFLITPDGVVATNAHVIEDRADARVRFIGGKTAWVRDILWTDPVRDLALLKIDGQNLPTVQLGDSDAVQVGEQVVAIGNPMGLQNTVSEGIISGIRAVPVGNTEVRLLQMTAPISPGSSGGPLFNAAGKVIGITAITLLGGQNLNLAIPINDLKAGIPRPGWLTPPSVARPQEEAPAGPQPEGGYILHLRDGRTIEVREYWEHGDEIRYPKFGGTLGIPRRDVAVIENKADGTKKTLNPFYTERKLSELKAHQEEADRQARAKRREAEEEEQERWVRDALYGDVVAQAYAIALVYSRRLIMGLPTGELLKLSKDCSSLLQKLDYRARYGESLADRRQAAEASLLLADRQQAVVEELVLR